VLRHLRGYLEQVRIFDPVERATVMFHLENIDFSLSQNKILKEIHCDVKPGAMLAIMGLNGAGKTTLLRLLSDSLKPTQGQITFGGKSYTEYTHKKLAQKIAYVPQDFPVGFPFTVEEFILMGRYAWQTGLFHSKKDYEELERVLQELEITEFRKRQIKSLSGGERQRVLLARALIQNTEVILLDEPTNHLDIKHTQFFMQKLKRANLEQGKTVIAVMHDISLVKKYFSEVLMLKEGAAQFMGPTSQGFTAERIKEVFEVSEIL
jgi:iron complex transport system ATP-binding protein